MTDYAFINIDDPENKKVFFITKEYPTILPIEHSKPDLDPVLFNIKESPINQWKISDDKVTVTYEVKEKTLKEEKDKVKVFFEHLYKEVRNGGLPIEYNDQKVFVSTKEENYELISDALKNINETKTIDWENDPVQWQTVDKERLELMKEYIIDHYDRCEDNLYYLLELVDASQTIHALHEIEYLEGWPNVILVTYEDGSVRVFLMTELLDEDGYLR